MIFHGFTSPYFYLLEKIWPKTAKLCVYLHSYEWHVIFLVISHRAIHSCILHFIQKLITAISMTIIWHFITQNVLYQLDVLSVISVEYKGQEEPITSRIWKLQIASPTRETISILQTVNAIEVTSLYCHYLI